MIAEHTSHDDPDFSEESFDDLVRYPANSKSRFDLEEYDAAAQQRQHCNLFIHSAGVNRDLVEPPDKIRSATPRTHITLPHNKLQPEPSNPKTWRQTCTSAPHALKTHLRSKIRIQASCGECGLAGFPISGITLWRHALSVGKSSLLPTMKYSRNTAPS